MPAKPPSSSSQTHYYYPETFRRTNNTLIEASRFASTFWKPVNDPVFILLLSSSRSFLHSSIPPILLNHPIIFHKKDINEVLNFLVKNCSTLQFMSEIDFPPLHLNSKTLENFVCHLLNETFYFPRQLRKFNVAKIMTTKLIQDVIDKSLALESLDICSGDSTFSQEAFRNLGSAPTCFSLRHLRLSALAAPLAFSGALGHLQKLVNLRSFEVTQCGVFTDTNLRALSAAKCLKSVSIIMCSSKSFTGSGFDQLSSLQEIDIRGCTKFNNEGMKVIGRVHGNSLIKIKLQACKSVTQEGFEDLFDGLSCANDITLTCPFGTIDNPTQLGTVFAASACATTLRKVSLTYFPTVSQRGFLQELSQTMINLEELSLFAATISGEDVCQIIPEFRNLRHFRFEPRTFDGQHMLDKKSRRFLLRKLPGLMVEPCPQEPESSDEDDDDDDQEDDDRRRHREEE